MSFGVPLAWRQLLKEKKRVVAAAAGIVFAVTLMLIQLGFQEALMLSAGLHANALACDLILATPQYQYLLQPGSFPERRLYQAAADPRVQSVAPLYLTGLPWKNPVTRDLRMILVMGAPPRHGVFSIPAIDGAIENLRDPEQALFDAKGRTEFGPVADELRAGRTVETEIANRRVVVTGLFDIGTTFGVDGTVVVGDDAFLRMMPGRDPGAITLGLVRLKPEADAETVRADLERVLPADVRVYTRPGFIAHEQQYWSRNTPVGFLFKLGVGMGLLIGLVIVYQILYTDVMQNIEEYATLKAIGFSNGYLAAVVLEQGLILSVLGFVPGAAISAAVYVTTAKATFLPLEMTPGRLLFVYALTAAMCVAAAALAMRPVRTVDPADIL
jgi:putative ABC transport system permease protein